MDEPLGSFSPVHGVHRDWTKLISSSALKAFIVSALAYCHACDRSKLKVI